MSEKERLYHFTYCLQHPKWDTEISSEVLNVIEDSFLTSAEMEGVLAAGSIHAHQWPDTVLTWLTSVLWTWYWRLGHNE